MGELWSWVMLTPHVGTELVAMIRQLDSASGGPLWVEGYGEVRDPVVLTQSDAGGRFERRLTGVWDLVSLRGSPKGDLFALLARESALGPQHVGGLLASAQVVSGAVRHGTEESATAGHQAPSPTPAAPHASQLPAQAPVAAPPPAPAGPTASPSSPGVTTAPTGTAMPKRPAARDTSVEQYPEEGDSVTHFAFGRCLVLFSDGERLRLQQERDGRVREVALSMLKIGDPTSTDGGPKHWDLARKN